MNSDKSRNLLYMYFTFIFLSILMDIYEEYSHWDMVESFIFHFSFELITLILTIVIFVLLLSVHLVEKAEMQAIKKHHYEVETTLEVLRGRIKETRNDYLNMVKSQFKAWEFTPMEQELGLLLLKGYSFDEIAQARNITDKTARKQAVKVYQKANVKNRNEFSAWFFEELI